MDDKARAFFNFIPSFHSLVLSITLFFPPFSFFIPLYTFKKSLSTRQRREKKTEEEKTQ